MSRRDELAQIAYAEQARWLLASGIISPPWDQLEPGTQEMFGREARAVAAAERIRIREGIDRLSAVLTRPGLGSGKAHQESVRVVSVDALLELLEGGQLTEPYWKDDLVTLYRGDALAILTELKAGTASSVVTDPPYVIGAVSAGNIGAKSGGWADMMNSAMWFSAWYRDCARILKHTGAIWSFCNWRSLPVVMRAAIDAGLPVTSLAVWDKEWIGPGGQQGLRPSYELIALLAKEGFAIPDRGIADVLRHKTGGYKPDGHPAQKPEGLVRRVLQISGLSPGDLVIDPFLGSGTTALAARSLGLRCIGIEAEERWCELAARRLSQADLFGGVA